MLFVIISKANENYYHDSIWSGKTTAPAFVVLSHWAIAQRIIQ